MLAANLIARTKSGVIIPAIGDAVYGGYYAGLIDTTVGNIIAADTSKTGVKYLLIVSPAAMQQVGIQFKTTNNAAPAACSTRWNGLAATTAMIGATYPFANYCNGLSYPADGGSQWYVPAMDELELVYRNLKCSTEANYIGARDAGTFPGIASSFGENISSSPAGAAYTAGTPAQTSVALFKTGAAQSIGANGTTMYYWASTEFSASDAWFQYFSGPAAGYQVSYYKDDVNWGLPVRRVVL